VANDTAYPTDDRSNMWHVTLTLAGTAVELGELREALERLAYERPFLLAARYSTDRAEVRYWEEAPDLASAVAMGLRLWEDHRASSRLPAWQLVGMEVVDHDTYQWRTSRSEAPALVAAGGVRPF
jgi:hypothetical protein